MRQTQTCPKCHGRKFLVAPEVTQPEAESANGTHPLAITCKWMETHPKPSWIATDMKRVSAGTFEAWICAGCGYIEWYAKLDPHTVQLLVGTALHVVDASGAEPFR